MTRSEKRRMKKKGVVLEILAAGGSVAGACSVVGIARCTFYDWQANDEWFDDGVMAIRRELMLANLEELQLQAYGRYVDEVTVRETDKGVVTTKRHRFLNGKLSALRRLIEQGLEDLPADEPTDEVAVSGVKAGVAESSDVVSGAVAPGLGEVEQVSDFEGRPGVAGVAEAGASDELAQAEVVATTGSTAACEGDAKAGAAADADVSDFEANVGTSTLRNRRRNKRQKLSKARGKKK